MHFCIYAGHPWVQVDGVAPDKPLDSAVLTRLKQFSAMNKFKKMALRVSLCSFGILAKHISVDLMLIINSCSPYKSFW